MTTWNFNPRPLDGGGLAPLRRAAPGWMAAAMLATLGLGCGDDGVRVPTRADDPSVAPMNPSDEPIDAVPDGPGPIGNPRARASASEEVCLDDADCAPGRHCWQAECVFVCDDENPCAEGTRCDLRGRCLREADAGTSAGGDSTGDAGDRPPVRGRATESARVVLDGPVVDWPPGADRITLPVRVDGELGPDGIAWRLSRSDRPDEDPLAQPLRHLRPEDAPRIVIEAPEERAAFDVVLQTANGTSSVRVVPRAVADGRWEGVLEVEGLGRSGVPVDLVVRTDPFGASLADARRAWLVLEVRDGAPLSPEAPLGGSVRSITRPLEWDAATRRHVARFEYAWAVAPGGLPEPIDAAAVHRSLRVELEEVESGRMRGRVLDRWDGLLPAARDPDAAPAPVVQHVGSLHLVRVGDAPDDRVEVTPHRPATSAVVGRVPLHACTADAGVFPRSVWVDDAGPGDGDGGEWVPLPDEPPGPTQLPPRAPREVRTLADWWDLDVALRVRLVQEAADELLAVDSLRAELEAAVEANDGARLELLTEVCVQDPEACAPSPALQCVRQLTARALHDAPSAPEAASLARLFEELSHEAVVGRQLAAFGADQRLRTEWLRDATLPGFVASLLRARSSERVADWKLRVLDVHRDVLAGYFDAAGMAVLSLEGMAQPDREALLLDVHEGVHALQASALTWARWAGRSGLDPAELEAVRHELRALLADLWRVSAVLFHLNRRADLGALNAQVASGWAVLHEELERLGRTWASALAWREGEVVLSTSLDPTASEQDLLRRYELSAQRAVEQAHATVETILEQNEVEAQNRQSLESRMESELRGYRQQLVELCGLPESCTMRDALAGSCDGTGEGATCGFPSDPERLLAEAADGAGASDAGRVLVRIVDAVHGVQQARDELDAHIVRTRLAWQDMQAYADDIRQLALLRAEGLEDMATVHAALQMQRAAAADALRESARAQLETRHLGRDDRERLERRVSALCTDAMEVQAGAQAAVLESRERMIDEHEREIDAWHRMTIDGVDEDYASVMEGIEAVHSANVARRAGAVRNEQQEQSAAYAQQGLDVLLNVATLNPVGVVSALGRLFRLGSDSDVASRRRRANARVERAQELQERLAAERQREQGLRQAELTLARNAFDVRRSEAGLEESVIQLAASLERERLQCEAGVLQRAVQASRDAQEIELARLHLAWQSEERERANAMQQIEEAWRRRESERSAEATLRAEIQGYRQRQLAWQQHVIQVSSLEIRLLRAEYQLEALAIEYEAVVTRAEAVADQLAWAEAQRERVRSLVLSPARLFARAARITAAEEQVENARSRLWDWLVALEYYAVRPFPEQRAALLLATAPSQMVQVAEELRRLESRCGGHVNRHSVAYSLRRDLAKIEEPREDLVSGEALSSGERFRRWLASAWLPVARRDALDRSRVVAGSSDGATPWAAAFRIDLDAFAHLGSSCNARIDAIGVELVGDVGFARPSVMLLHEGAGQVRSCQPGLDALLAQLGRLDSPFGSVSSLRTPSRSVSLLASVNRPPEPAERNRSLAGVPLAGEFTLVVAVDAPNNADVAWEHLDDLVLHFDFSTQDPFVEGACR